VPKQSLKISSFHNGLNSKSDPRDIKDDELAVSKNVYVDAIGKITLSGATSTIVTTGLDLQSLADGYGLFRFSSDYTANASEGRTDYIIVWDDATSKFYWLSSDTTAWASPAWLDVSADWATGETSIPVYYFVDGAPDSVILPIASTYTFLETANSSSFISLGSDLEFKPL